MNDRNVAALYAVLKDALYDGGWTILGVAERLAARGVLVPSALTEDELTIIWHSRDQFNPRRTVRVMEEIAKDGVSDRECPYCDGTGWERTMGEDARRCTVCRGRGSSDDVPRPDLRDTLG